MLRTQSIYDLFMLRQELKRSAPSSPTSGLGFFDKIREIDLLLDALTEGINIPSEFEHLEENIFIEQVNKIK